MTSLFQDLLKAIGKPLSVTILFRTYYRSSPVFIRGKVTTELLNLSHTETALDVVCLGFIFFFVREVFYTLSLLLKLCAV